MEKMEDFFTAMNLSRIQLFGTFASGFGMWIIWKLTSSMSRKKQMQKRIDLKYKQRKEQAQKLKEHLDKVQDITLWTAITSKTFEDLRMDLKNGDLKAIDVLRAYQWKALESTELLNNIVWFIEEAETEAMKLDEKPIEERGHLHGIPISVKECYYVKNCDSTAGCPQFLHDPVDHDCLMVKTLKSFGGIPFCLTNVPQTMLSLQCSNPAFGATGNAFDPKREAGGSSGGEGSLLGSGGSILGIGNDIGGSVRNPAIFNGIYSLKPTHGRHLTQNSNRLPVPYDSVIYGVGGFMSASCTAVKEAYRILYENIHYQASNDISIAPVKWQENLYDINRKLKIGYYLSDGRYSPHPGCQRAVREALTTLREMGHTVVEFHCAPEDRVYSLYFGLLTTDKLVHTYNTLTKDVFVDSAIWFAWLGYHVMRLPYFIRRFIVNPLIQTFVSSELLPEAITEGDDIMAHIDEKDKILTKWMKEWDELGLDLVITPASLMPAPLKGVIGEIPSATRPYHPFNLLNMPAGIVPTTKVTEQDDLNMDSMPNNDLVYKTIKKNCKGAIGMPLGIQIVGRRYQEELILALMMQLDQVSEFQNARK